MTQFILIHGAFGNPQENWFPWLKEQLESLGHTVIVPQFPTPENQTLENWKRIFENYTLTKETVLIGHSLGPAFILSALEESPVKIAASFLISGFLDSLGNEEFDRINSSFINKEFNWEKIKSQCAQFVVINSDTDPYVPLSQGEKLARFLGVELTVLSNAGHINEAAGFLEFPLLLEKILRF